MEKYKADEQPESDPTETPGGNQSVKTKKLPIKAIILTTSLVIGTVLLFAVYYFVFMPMVEITPTSTGHYSSTPASDVNETSGEYTLTEVTNNGWGTFSDDELGFSFMHPLQYTEANSAQYSESPTEGSYIFMGGSKKNVIVLNVVPYSEGLEQFIDEYTHVEPANGLRYANLHVATVLGDVVEQDNDSYVVYKYINHYDEEVNPGAVDRISYTVFLVRGGKGFVVRTSNNEDNLSEILQIANSIKT